MSLEIICFMQVVLVQRVLPIVILFLCFSLSPAALRFFPFNGTFRTMDEQKE